MWVRPASFAQDMNPGAHECMQALQQLDGTLRIGSAALSKHLLLL